MAEFAQLIRKSGDLQRLSEQNKARWAAAMEESVEVAYDVAVQLVPVRTGFLRDSIFYRRIGPLSWELGASADYSSFVELGTSRQEKQPFIEPALVLARRHLRNILAKG